MIFTARLLAATLSFCLFFSAPGFVPYQAAAQTLNARGVPVPISQIRVVATPLGRFAAPAISAPNIIAPVSGLQGLTPAPLLAPAAAVGAVAAEIASVKLTAKARAIKVLQGGAKAIAATAKSGTNASPREALDGLFENATVSPQPSDTSGLKDTPQGPRRVKRLFLKKAASPRAAAASSPEAPASVRRMMIGTAAMKTGMEVVALSIPFLIGGAGAIMIAGLLVAYSVSQAIFAGATGALASRFSEHTVLAGAVAVQAVFVGAVMVLGLTGMLTAWTLLPLYVLIGGAVGIVETSRQTMAALILGRNAGDLSKYNARMHIAYEVAGVAGALLGGALIGFAGPLWALLVQPPAYLLASYFFLRVSHAQPKVRGHAVSEGIIDTIKTYMADMKAGAKLILGDGHLRWVAIASVLPQIVHRLLEGLLAPVIAKNVLMAPKSAGWLLAASNAGELGGAAMVHKFSADHPWVKWCAAGTLGLVALALFSSLPILLAATLISSLTWASSDLRLRTELQSTIAEKDQPKALSFLYGAYVLGTALLSLAGGALISWLGVSLALYWIVGAFAAVAAVVFLASFRLRVK